MYCNMYWPEDVKKWKNAEIISSCFTCRIWVYMACHRIFCLKKDAAIAIALLSLSRWLGNWSSNFLTIAHQSLTAFEARRLRE